MSLSRPHFFALVAILLSCSALPAAAELTYTYNGQKYSGAQQALAAQRRDLDAQVAAVPTSAGPIHAKALIVLPDRDRLRPLAQAVLKTPLSADALSYAVEFTRDTLWSVANAIVKARVFDAVQILERNDTVQPPFDGYDYLIWYDKRFFLTPKNTHKYQRVTDPCPSGSAVCWWCCWV
jgi:hypothetical protein